MEKEHSKIFQKLWKYKYFYGPILCLSILTYLFIYKGKDWQAKDGWDYPEASSLFKLLPEEKYKSKFMYHDLWLGPKNHCECAQRKNLVVYQLDDYIDKDKLDSVTKRREKEYKDYQRRYSHEKKDVLIAPPNIPLSYPIQGAEVIPLHTIVIPGLGFHGQNTEKQKVLEEDPENKTWLPELTTIEVTLEASFGTLDTLAEVPQDIMHGQGKKKLIISTSDVKLLNHILKHVTYTSTEYILDVVDFVTFTTEDHHVRFPVTIRQPRLPKLHDPGPDNNIRNLVTITTKTFLRYHKVRALIRSIRKYYPDITIIVADDSEHPEKIQEPNVEQFIMPFAKGWFAGRNLAISQVTTKYYLWVDDDFLFTENTKIEEFVTVLENTNLDVVGGTVKGNDFKFQLIYEEGEVSSCLHIRFGSYHQLEGFPRCVVTSGVVNFFLARTEESRSIGFDPMLLRVAHSEYFIDGLGSLRVGSCSHVSVDHQPHESANNLEERSAEQKYKTFRTSTKAETNFKLALQFFKNRLKCYTRG